MPNKFCGAQDDRAAGLFERAGFRRIGVVRKRGHRLSAATHYGVYGWQARLTTETIHESRASEPVDYEFDNRKSLEGEKRDWGLT